MISRLDGSRRWLFPLLCASLLLLSAGAAVAQPGLSIKKACPTTANPGDVIECTISVENNNPGGSVNNLLVTNQFPFDSGPVVPVAGCGTTLGPSDGATDAGPDFTSCKVMEQIPAECEALQLLLVDEAVASGTDSSTNSTVKNSTTNGVAVFCGAIPEFPVPAASLGGLVGLAIALGGFGALAVSRRRR